MLRKRFEEIKQLGKNISSENINAFAASTAFFIFLSLVPMLIIICATIPYTPLTEDMLLKVVGDVTPSKLYPLAEDLVRDVYAQSAGILPMAVVITLFTAGKGMLALMRGLNAIGDVKETRNYLWVRLVASFYTALLLAMIMVTLFVMVFGNRLVDMLLYKMPHLRPLVALLMNLRFLAIWILLMLVFAAIYAYVPNGRLRFLMQIPGAAFTAIGWSVFSWGFSLYVDWTDYSIYGSLALIILIMLWTYACMYIVMIGAFINKCFLILCRKEGDEKP
ncbi:MAG: YihY/virulence factor BrkB family protein [Lachnospiraceae bacterium]|nr:YihY/virulence factor BrkB family protein [Lachnospiraceae bacterium]